MTAADWPKLAHFFRFCMCTSETMEASGFGEDQREQMESTVAICAHWPA